MSSKSTGNLRAGWIAVAATGLMLLAAAYALSYAPIAFAFGREPPKALTKFYDPLCTLADRTPLRIPLEWWSDVWEVPAPSHIAYYHCSLVERAAKSIDTEVYEADDDEEETPAETKEDIRRRESSETESSTPDR